MQQPPMRAFGCARCYGDDAAATWSRRDGLRIERELVDDSHFIVQLRRCSACGQRFVWIFSEVVDWEHGDDAQYRDILPVTDAEAETLERQGADYDLAYLSGLGRDRRYLWTSWPTGQKEQEVGWASGPLMILDGR